MSIATTQCESIIVNAGKYRHRENQQRSSFNMENVQRPALKQGVGASAPKWEAPNHIYKDVYGEDMVLSE